MLKLHKSYRKRPPYVVDLQNTLAILEKIEDMNLF